MKAQARFTFEKVSFEQDKDVHLVVSLQAPKIDWQSKRPSVCIIPCIDISGSMQGQKLDYAKKSVLKLIDHLQPGDYCGLVVFESHVSTISPPVEMTQARKDELKVKVGELHTMGGTNFSGGMMEALAHANKTDLPNGVALRVIMFTDGQANEGIARDRKSIVELLGANMGKATVSAFGYGVGCDQDLLSEVSKVGKGNYAFVKDPDDALSAFARELGGLLSSYAQNIQVELIPHGEHKITEVISDVDSVGDKTGCKVKIPDLLSEESRHLVFGVSVSKQPKAFPRATSVVDVKLEFDTIGEDKKKQHHIEELKGKLEFVKPGSEDTSPINEVMELVGLALIVQKQLEAEEMARGGNFAGAQGAMANLGGVLRSCGLGVQAVAAQAIGSRMSDQVMYSNSGGYLNSVSRGLSSGYTVSSYDPEAAKLMENLNVVVSNDCQDAVLQSFTSESKDEVKVDADAVAVVAGTSGIGIVVPPGGGGWASNGNGVLTPEPKSSVAKKHSKRW